MSSFSVETVVLVTAAWRIEMTSTSATWAGRSATLAAGQSGAFGGEPIGGAFEAMCERARLATTELAQTMQQLSGNVSAAASVFCRTTASFSCSDGP
jgi:hypothetical protein